jgi:hypothetical protein
VVVGAAVVVVTAAVVGAWVVVAAGLGVVTVLDAEGEPPQAPRTAASATAVRSALRRILR